MILDNNSYMKFINIKYNYNLKILHFQYLYNGTIFIDMHCIIKIKKGTNEKDKIYFIITNSNTCI